MKKNQDILKKQKSGYLLDKKSWILFIIQLSFMILSFVLILWGQKKLRSFGKKSNSGMERKAEFIAPKQDIKDLKEP